MADALSLLCCYACPEAYFVCGGSISATTTTLPLCCYCRYDPPRPTAAVPEPKSFLLIPKLESAPIWKVQAQKKPKKEKKEKKKKKKSSLAA